MREGYKMEKETGEKEKMKEKRDRKRREMETLLRDGNVQNNTHMQTWAGQGAAESSGVKRV